MSDPEAAGAVTDDAAALAAEASGGDAGAAVGPAMDGAASVSESKGLLGALMHTDPDLDPTAVHGPEWAGHAIVGLRKMMDALGIEAGEGEGTPAVMNLAQAARGLYEEYGSEPDQGGDDGGETTGQSVADPEVTVRD